MKYIIKNCPACTISPTCCSKWHIENGNAKDCSDIPDCLLKRIVKLSKEYKYEIINRKTKKAEATSYFPLTREILELLEIEEAE